MKPRETIAAFDAYLAQRSLSLDAVVIGGCALGLLGVTTRQTRDCDILAPDLPESVSAVAREFAVSLRSKGAALDDDWLNNGPSSLISQLSPAWRERLQIVFSGAALTLRCLGRVDLLCSKLFALCDRGIDLADCIALAPTRDELFEIEPWVAAQDTNPEWPAHVRSVFENLSERMKHGA